MLDHLNEYFNIMVALNTAGKTQPLMAIGLKAKLNSLAKRTESQHLRNRISMVLQETVKTTG